ncbi:MAG TPA: RnfABCDGE type electron transport complex subunit D [Thermoplasmata archaeon]|nr:RnfABCDGE type electron transport complex subunit D [Thermoplasmata archaeon]
MSESPALWQVFCRTCGRSIDPGSTCPSCGWVDRLGLEERRASAPPTPPVLAVRPAPPVPAEPAAPLVPPSAPAPKPAPPRARTSPRKFGLRTIWKRYLPPVRLVWIFLAILVWNGHGFASRAVAEPLLLLPVIAAVADLAFQLVRFPKLRFPDAAIANGLFLTVILWPTGVSLALLSVVLVTVGLRHVARVGGHPILNPAAAGVLVAATVFALPQPWHVGVTTTDVALVALLGAILWSKATHTWRILVPYFAVNIAASLAVAEYLGGPSAVRLVFQASVLGAATVFYGFFMVSEPRTAPSARPAMLMFGALVGFTAAVLPVLFAEYPTYSALGVLTPYLALFIGNVFAVALPSARGARRPTTHPTSPPRRAAAGTPGPES